MFHPRKMVVKEQTFLLCMYYMQCPETISRCICCGFLALSKVIYSKLNNNLLLSRFMKKTLDQYVEMDYVIVYFHHGLTSKNKPKLSWMVQVYRELDRKWATVLNCLSIFNEYMKKLCLILALFSSQPVCACNHHF